MPRILTTCPTTGETVPTGHRTTTVDFAELDAPRSFRCPVCQQVHEWSAENARVEETLSLAPFRSAA